MSKKLTSLNTSKIGNAISDGVGRLTDLSLNTTVTSISYVDDSQITLDKVIIKQTDRGFPGSPLWLLPFILGLVIGFITGLFLQKTPSSSPSPSANSNILPNPNPPQLSPDELAPALPPENQPPVDNQPAESIETYYSQPNQ